MAGLNEYITPTNEITGAYILSGFNGGESDTEFLSLMGNRERYPDFV